MPGDTPILEVADLTVSVACRRARHFDEPLLRGAGVRGPGPDRHLSPEIEAVVDVLNTPTLSIGPRLEQWVRGRAMFDDHVFAVSDRIAALYLGRMAGEVLSKDVKSNEVVEMITTGTVRSDGMRLSCWRNPAAVAPCSSSRTSEGRSR